MSRLPKKKSRRIVVDDIAYRWMFKGWTRYFKTSPLSARVLIQLEDSPGELLHVDLEMENVTSDDEDMGTYRASIMPSNVFRMILVGLKEGWNPNDKKQKLFKLKSPINFNNNPQWKQDLNRPWMTNKYYEVTNAHNKRMD